MSITSANSRYLNKFFAILFISCFFLYFVASALDEIDQQKQVLEKTRQQLKEVQDRIKTLDEEEKGGLARIEALEQKIFLTQKLIRELRSLTLSTQKEVTKIRGSIKETEDKIEKRMQD